MRGDGWQARFWQKEYHLGVAVSLPSATETKTGDCFCQTVGKRNPDDRKDPAQTLTAIRHPA